MMHCRMMEVQSACCGDARNCPDDSPVPRRCPVQCALVFPTLVDSCAEELESGGLDIDEFRSFADDCLQQDTTGLVEYASSLLSEGCTVQFEDEGDDDRGRRLTDVEQKISNHTSILSQRRFGSKKEQSKTSATDTMARRLQGEGELNPACKDFVDDPSGNLAATGVDCEQVLLLGCDTDLHRSQPEMPEGSLVSILCPVSCNECHRSGMAKIIEAPLQCQWDHLDGRVDEANEVCCGEDPNRACARGAPPRECPPLCAVTFHKLITDCGDFLLHLAGDDNRERFTDFDELVSTSVTLRLPVYIGSFGCCQQRKSDGLLCYTVHFRTVH
eukprot:SAG31_NODE_2048_length_6565_cov_2.692700_6_plen_329_part_00